MVCIMISYGIYLIQFCYCRLQRKIMFFLYGSLPQSSYAEAYKYFEQAEELKPRFYIPNMCMLGTEYKILITQC